MFASYSECTASLLNITLSLYSPDTFTVVPPCDTWQEVLSNTLKYDVDGSFMDVVSSGTLAATPPASLSEESVATSIDAVLFLVVYLSVFVAYSEGIHKIP